jgi:Ca-activated chloride channel family protein
MTFLAPMTGLIAACVAVPALVALYLLKLRRRPVRVSSTLLWQRAVRDVQANVPLARLRLSMLFLLQLLALACLLGALARPAIPGQGVEGRRVVLLIDRSASMNTRDLIRPEGPRASRLEEAVRLARQIIDDAPRGQMMMLVQFAAQAQALTPMTADRTLLREALAAITPTDQPGNLHAAMELVRSLATIEVGADEATDLATAVVLSDGGFPRAADPLSAASFYGVIGRYVRVGSEGREGGWDNRGIVSIGARRDFDDPASVRLFARILNAATTPQAVVAVLSVDGREVQRRAVRLPATTVLDGPTGGRVEPGEANAVFTFTNTEGGVVSVSLVGEDLLASDNSASLVLGSSRLPRVVVVAPDPPEGRELSADRPLVAALEAARTRSVRVVSAGEYERGAVRAAAGPDDEVGADLIVFDRVTPRRMIDLPSLSFGAGLPAWGGAPAVIATAREDSPPRIDRFITWDRDHPVMRYLALDTIIARPSLKLGWAGDAAARVETLANGQDGPLVVLRRDGRGGGLRRIVVGFSPERSSWPESGSFPIFIINALEHTTARSDAGEGGGWVRTTEPVVIQTRGTAPTLTLELADGSRRSARIVRDPDGSAGEASFGVIERAGLARVSAADTGPGGEAMFVAVNLADTNESLIRAEPTLPTQGGPLESRAQGALGGLREIWSWFIAAALVLLSLEWVLHSLMMRRL